MRILVVEDEHYTREVLQATLKQQNFLVDQATDGEMAWEMLQQFSYDLVLLDVGLPKLDGFELCRRLRQAENPVLILVLTIRDRLSDKLLGFENGADDYLVKPFELPELTARIRSLSRRHGSIAPPVLTYGLLCLDPIARQVSYSGLPIKLGRKEYLLLELLLRHPNQVFSRADLIDRLWSLDQEIPTEATIKSHIRSIRRKFEQVGAVDAIETLYGQGYRLNALLLKSTQSSVTSSLATQSSVTSSSATPSSAVSVQSAMQTSLSVAALEQVDQFTAHAWRRAYAKGLEQIAELEQGVLGLQAGQFAEASQQEAIFIAHKLAGAMAVFGFERASQVLLQIEEVFRQSIVLAEQAGELLQWLEVVRSELSGQEDVAS